MDTPDDSDDFAARDRENQGRLTANLCQRLPKHSSHAVAGDFILATRR